MAGAQVATIIRVTAAGPYLELADARGYEVGPALTTVAGLAKGDRVLVLPMDRDPDEFAVLGRLL